MKLVPRNNWKDHPDWRVVPLLNGSTSMRCNLTVNERTVKHMGACFGTSHLTRVGDQLTTWIYNNHFINRAGAVAKVLGIDTQDLKKLWFEKELPSIMEDEKTTITLAKGDDPHYRCSFPSFDTHEHPRRNLAQLFMLDFIQRFPGHVFAYLMLRHHLPEVKPWDLFQVVLSIPSVHGGYAGTEGKSQRVVDLNVVGSVASFHSEPPQHGLYFHNIDEQEMGGLSPLRASFKDAVNATVDYINHDFMLTPIGGYADPDATWDEFATFADNYIKTREV